jgi:thioredoxin 1
VVTFLSLLDGKCKAVTSKIKELSDKFTSVKFYQVNIRKHAMLSRALSSTELPIIIFIKNSIDILTLALDVSLLRIQEGL